MSKEDQRDQTVYFKAMMRGAGDNESQALELLTLDNRDFVSVTRFVRHLVDNPEQFHNMARIVSLVHKSVNKATGRELDTHITADDFLHDMYSTLSIAATNAPIKSRRKKLYRLINKCNRDVL